MTTNSGFWEDGLEATANRLNASLLQRDTLANRPAAGQAGRLFVCTDGNNAGLMFRDSGTAWVQVTLSDQAAGTPSLRTLGTNATQAAAGNHQHALTYAFVQSTASSTEATSSSWDTGETDEKTVVDHAITPGAATNRTIAISLTGNAYWHGLGSQAMASNWTIKIKNSSTTIKTWTGQGELANAAGNLGALLVATHQPNSTNAQTYTMTAANGSTWSGGYEMRMNGRITLMEISGAV